MRALVIGGAGFLGSHLVDRLLAEQHAVEVVDDLSTGSLANLAEARASGGELKIHHLDACSTELGTLISMREPEVVYHLGWLPPGRRDPHTVAAAVHSTLVVLEAARLLGTAKVVTAVGAASLYGEVPARELPVKEGRPWAPAGTVGVIGRAVCDLLALYRDRHDVEFTAVALGEVYGPRQRRDGGLVAMLAGAAADGEAPVVAGDGRRAVDLLYVDDAVDAFVRAATRGGGLVVNVGTGILVPVRDLWDRLGGPDAPAPRLVAAADDELARFAVSPTRARIHLAWAPWTELETGLRAVRRSLR